MLEKEGNFGKKRGEKKKTKYAYIISWFYLLNSGTPQLKLRKRDKWTTIGTTYIQHQTTKMVHMYALYKKKKHSLILTTDIPGIDNQSYEYGYKHHLHGRKKPKVLTIACFLLSQVAVFCLVFGSAVHNVFGSKKKFKGEFGNRVI